MYWAERECHEERIADKMCDHLFLNITEQYEQLPSCGTISLLCIRPDRMA